MKFSHLLLALIVISACAQVNVKAQNDIFDIFRAQIEKYINKYMDSDDPNLNKMQFKFIQQFLKSIIFGEIRLYDYAISQKDNLSEKEVKDIKLEVDALIETLFQGRYNDLQHLINDIKKENPKEFQGIFSEATFQKDIQVYENQEKLANAIINKLFQSQNVSENLVESLKDVEKVKKFLIKYKGLSEKDLEKSIEYLKDAKKIKESLQNLIQKLSDATLRQKLINLAVKLATSQQSGGDLFEILYSDEQLANLLLDNDWSTLMKIKDQLYAIGGKAYEDYQKKRSEEQKQKEIQKEKEDEEQEEEEEENDKDDDKSSSLSFGKIILILTGIAFVIGLVFIGLRKYRQTKVENVTFKDERYYVNSTL